MIIIGITAKDLNLFKRAIKFPSAVHIDPNLFKVDENAAFFFLFLFFLTFLFAFFFMVTSRNTIIGGKCADRNAKETTITYIGDTASKAVRF